MNNSAYINFNSNDRDMSDTLYDCKILSQGGTSGTPGSGTLTLYSKTTTFKGDVDASQNNVPCKTLTLNGSDLADSYYTKVQSDNNYYTKTESDTNYYTKTSSDNRYYIKTDSDNRYYTKTDSDNNYYSKTQSDSNYYSKTYCDSTYATIVSTDASIATLEGEIATLGETLVDLGLVTGGIGTFSLFSSVVMGGGVSVERSRCMRLSGQQSLMGNISFTSDRYTFAGATPTQLSYLGSVTSDIQTQLNNKAPLANQAFTGTATLGGQHIATTNQILSMLL